MAIEKIELNKKLLSASTEGETDVTGHPLIPLEKTLDGDYPFPRIRYGISPYYLNDLNEIVWGWIESNRVEPVTFEPAAGTQDIIAIKGDQRLVLELGKPIPNSNHEFSFLHHFTGQAFRDKVYQDALACLVTNGFSVYLESPLATAIHEAYDEHGIDLRKNIGRDNQLLQIPLELTQYELIPAQAGVASPLCLWLPELTKLGDIVLRHTNKIDTKMRRNFGREFYEKGTWLTLESFKIKLSEEKAKFSSLDIYTPVRVELITEAFRACDRNMQFLERAELSLLKKPHQAQLENTNIIFSSQSELAAIPIMSQGFVNDRNVFFKPTTSGSRATGLVCTSALFCKNVLPI